MRPIFAAFARHSVFANILLIIILVAGGIAATSMVRETFPEFSLDMITVTVPWPGADPEEVEEGISRKIEEAIQGVEGIKQYNTNSGENLATATIEVLENYDLNEVKERVRNAIDSISSFPPDAERPIIAELLLRDEVLMVALYGSGMSERRLKEWGENVKEEIRNLPEVSQVQIFGTQEYEIAIEVSEERLREYGLSFREVSDAVRRGNLNLSGGTMRTQGEEIRLRTMGRKYTGKELAEIVVVARPDGDVITLDRIATIKDDFVEDTVLSRFNGEPAIMLSVLKTDEEDTLTIARAVRAYVADKEAALPEGLHMSTWADLSSLLDARINLLVKNGIAGLILVFVLLWLFLDIRLSFWAGMGMPISIAGALVLLWLVGATINMISLFGLIMVIGIIVDDAIIVGEAIYVARKNGKPPFQAAVDGVSEVGLPVIAAVTTSIVAFIPLLYVSGIMGKFISILPVVVIACLVVSLVECLIILPAHLNHLPDPQKKPSKGHPFLRLGQRIHATTNGGMEWASRHLYGPFIRTVLRWRYVGIACAFSMLLLTVGLIQGGILKFTVFPKLDSDIVTATVEFPSGTPLAITEEAIRQIEEAFLRIADRTETDSGDPLLKNMFSLIGSTISDADIPQRGNHYGSVRAELLDSSIRGVYSEELMSMWENEIGVIPGVDALSFAGLSAGPPGRPIEIWIQGHNLEYIRAAADDLKDELSSYDGVYQIQHDFRPGKSELRFSLKPEASTLGLTVADLAQQLYAGYFGEEAVRLQRGRDDVRVRVRYPAEKRAQVGDLDQVRIRTPFGQEVPLLSVADVEYAPGFSNIQRTDGMRRAKVEAEVNPAKANAAEIFADLNAGYFASLERSYPGIMVSQQGEQKKMTESFGSLAVGYPLAMLGIFIIIATIFRSYIQPFVILFTIPFGVIGAILTHFVMGYDLSMMSMFGIVALSGVVVNDAIVMIERVNENVAEGMKVFDAIRKAGQRRFRAIMLTSLSTVGGLMPLILERDVQAQFLVPMALSIAGGVAFATVLTLVLIPCLLMAINDIRRIIHYVVHRRWPSREEVEPARHRYVDPDRALEMMDAEQGALPAK